MTKFYTFKQNNSGGEFIHEPEDGIGYAVCVEARSAEEANAKARDFGIYFDGCIDGYDCDCCGDRWSVTDEDDGYSTPRSAYGGELKGGRKIPAYIHYIDGRIVEVPCD